MARELVGYVQQHGDHLYIQAPVVPMRPTDAEIEQFAFAGGVAELKKQAPNPHIVWLQGRYVEADNANSNGDQWTAGELGIKSLTPVFMPITVMHDMRSAVGTIADAALRTPTRDSVPRARIETVLALWRHRFPEVAAEAVVNAEQGTLMQSMECIAPDYECSACGQVFHRLPQDREREFWCAHLTGENVATMGGQRAARILRSVIFTGTGLIFGTRGARGAYPEAYLEVEALAEMFAKAHHDTAHRTPTKPRPTRRANAMEIEDSKYAELVAKATKGEQAETQVTELRSTVAQRDKTIEEKEAELVAERARTVAVEAERDAAKEEARVATLRDERLASLGKAFRAKIDAMPTAKARLTEQAGKFSDEDWSARLAELSETTGVRHDDDTDPTPETPNAAAAAAAAASGGDAAAQAAAAKAAQEQAAQDASNPIFAGADLSASGVGTVTAGAAGTSPVQAASTRQSVARGLMQPRQPVPSGTPEK
jgi:hypothetical protein